MISTYTPLPLLTTGSGHVEAPTPGADAARDDNAPSFQARLDQQNDMYRAHRAPVSARPAPAAPRPDDADTANPPDTDVSDPVSSRTSDGADSVRRDDADNDGRADKAEEGDKDRRSSDVTPSVTPALPFTTATLALAGGIAPISTPAASIPALPVMEHTANGSQAANAPVFMEANVSGLASTVAPAAANAASTLPHVSDVSANGPLNIPLNTPGVSMDSNAAGKTAASGVANASPPISAQAAPAPLATPLPNAANAVTLAAAQTTAVPAQSAPGSASGVNPGTLNIAPAVAQAAQTTDAPQAAASSSASLAETTQADILPVTPLAPGDTIAAQRSDKAAAAVVTLPLPAASGAAAGASLAIPSAIPSGATMATEGAGGTSPSQAASREQSKEQNLGGIERMLTLGAGKTQASGANAASDGETADTASLNAALSSGENRAAAAQRGGYTAHTPGANPAVNAAAPGTAASLPNASPANANPASADPTSAINPQADTLAASGMTNAAAAPPGSTTRMAEALQFGGKNSLTGPAPLAAAEPTSPGANATASLLATPEASAHATGQDTLNGQAQSDTPARSQDNADGDNATANLNGIVPAQAANTQATLGTGATTASGPNGSSQIDRAQVVAQVTQHLEGMRLANGNGEMRLRLTPGHLGNVQISVTAHHDGVVARIAVETAQIQQVMDGAKAHLRATLEARGLHVQSVDITVTPHYNGGGQSAFGQQRSPESMGERMAERAAYGRALPASTPTATDSAVSLARAVPLAHTANTRLDCQA